MIDSYVVVQGCMDLDRSSKLSYGTLLVIIQNKSIRGQHVFIIIGRVIQRHAKAFIEQKIQVGMPLIYDKTIEREITIYRI
jgi:hypothetical protein